MSFIEGALSGAMLFGIASLAGWISYNDKQHLRYTQWLYRRKEPATKSNSFVYKRRKFDRDAFIKGEAAYINSLEENERKTGYEKLKKNSRLKQKYPGYYSALMQAYSNALDRDDTISDIYRNLSECLDNYKRIYISAHQDSCGGVATDSLFDSCQKRLSSTSEDDLLHFYDNAGGDLKIMALSMIDTECDYAEFLLQKDIKLNGQTDLSAGASQYIDEIRLFYKDQVSYVLLGISPEDVENAGDSNLHDDEFLNDFECVDQTKERMPISTVKEKRRMWKAPLLILCIILFATITAVLSVGAHYAGMKAGYQEGYSSGKDDGYTNGYNDGVYDGYKKGYNAGYDDGRAAVDLEVPYDHGYEDGYNDAINGY